MIQESAPTGRNTARKGRQGHAGCVSLATMVVRVFPLLCFAILLTGCPSAPAPFATASASPSTQLAPSASASAPLLPASPPAVVSAPPPSVSALTLLPPSPPNPAPIRDCDPFYEPGKDADCLGALEKTTRNRSLAECKKIDALPGYSAAPTAFARGFHKVIEGCFQDAMVRELDRRLLPLKSFDAVAFHREMALQKAFNEAVRVTCDDVMDHEQSTGDFRGEFRCTTFLLELRARQAEAINAGGLSVKRAPAARVARAGRFKPFATQLCALEELWKPAPPDLCEGRILGEIEDTLAAAARF